MSNTGQSITYPIPLLESLNDPQQSLNKVFPIQSGCFFSKPLIVSKLSSTGASLISSMEEENEDTQNTSSSSSCSGFNPITSTSTEIKQVIL